MTAPLTAPAPSARAEGRRPHPALGCCVLCFDGETGWGHWAVAVPGRLPLFLTLVDVETPVRAITDLAGHTLVVRRRNPGAAPGVTLADRECLQWNSWVVEIAWMRDGWREAWLRPALIPAVCEVVSGHAM
jgi:hypothetical protein